MFPWAFITLPSDIFVHNNSLSCALLDDESGSLCDVPTLSVEWKRSLRCYVVKYSFVCIFSISCRDAYHLSYKSPSQ